MTEQHPITPPPELFKQWEGEPRSLAFEAAYRAGADQELKACLQWFSEFYSMETWMQKDLEKFRAARRSKPPSLKEQALVAFEHILNYSSTELGADTIRRALEQLDD